MCETNLNGVLSMFEVAFAMWNSEKNFLDNDNGELQIKNSVFRNPSKNLRSSENLKNYCSDRYFLVRPSNFDDY